MNINTEALEGLEVGRKKVVSSADLFRETLDFDFTDSVRAYEEYLLNHQFQQSIRELLQNVPWHSLAKLKITVKKIDDRTFELRLLDDDYGCNQYTMETSLLTLKGKKNDSVRLNKHRDNKYGQGLIFMVLKTLDKQIYCEMKTKDMDNAISCTIFGDSKRSILWDTPTNPQITTDSGFFISMKFEVPDGRKIGGSPEKFVDILYDTVKDDLQNNLQQRVVQVKLIGFDRNFVSKWDDLNAITPKKELYYKDEHMVEVTDKREECQSYRNIRTTVSDVNLLLNKLSFAKRPGETELIRRGLIDDRDEYKTDYLNAEYGDTPIIRIISHSTKNLLHKTTVPYTGRTNRNGGDWEVEIDIQSSDWDSVTQTKTPFFADGDPRVQAIIEQAIFEYEKLYPDDKNAEQCNELWIQHCLVRPEQSPDQWAVKFWKGEKLYTYEEGKTKIDVYGPKGFEFMLDLDETEREFKVITQRRDGKLIPDLYVRNENNIPLSNEVKPKPFTVDYLRQALEQFVSTPKEQNQQILWSINLKKHHYKDFNTRVSENWKQGKIDSDAKFIYIDIAKLGFTDSIKNKYMKHIKYLEQMSKTL